MFRALALGFRVWVLRGVGLRLNRHLEVDAQGLVFEVGTVLLHLPVLVLHICQEG